MASQRSGRATRFLPVSDADAQRMRPEMRERLTPSLAPSPSTLRMAIAALCREAKVYEAVDMFDPDADLRTVALTELQILLNAAEVSETTLQVAA